MNLGRLRMSNERLNPADVRNYDNSRLVGDFEVASRKAFDKDLTIAESETAMKNLNTLREEIYLRLSCMSR